MPRTTALRRLGRRIADLREARSVTQEVLARRLDVSVRTIAGIEAGASTTTQTLVEIAQVLGVELEALFARVVKPRR